MMEKNFIIQLTQNLYRLTLLFPKKEPLRYKMREVADEILADFISVLKDNPYKSLDQKSLNIGQMIEKLEILDCFFEVAKEQNWVKPAELFEIQKEYGNLREELKKEELILKTKINNHQLLLSPVCFEGQLSKPCDIKNSALPAAKNQLKATLTEPQPRISKLSERQEKILAFLKENGRAQVWQIKQILPEVSKRTLRRDFDYLVKKGVIERVGERNNTFYQIKISQS